jgi:isopropylmalate/homocitrate/citramalate synthase
MAGWSTSDTAVSTHAVAAARSAGITGRRVTICDCTLRDGEQTAGVHFSLDDRVAIARALDDAGVGQIQLSYPGLSRSDVSDTDALVGLRLRATTEVIAMLHTDNWEHQVDAAVDTGADVVSLIHGVSDIRLRDVYGITPDEAVSRIRRGIERARARGAKLINVSPTDTPRCSRDVLTMLYPAVVAAGADRVRINDSSGSCSPLGMRRLVELVRGLVAVPVGVHCHDDFGLALANTVASVEAGAAQVDVCVNGLGERAGNAALEEVVATLELLYGIDTGVDLSRLTSISELVAGASGYDVPRNKAVVGREVFSHTFATHIRDFVAGGWALHEPFQPSIVGNRRRFPLHRMSGPDTIRLWLSDMALEPEPALVERLLARVRARATIEEVDELGFRQMVRDEQGALGMQGPVR